MFIVVEHLQSTLTVFILNIYILSYFTLNTLSSISEYKQDGFVLIYYVSAKIFSQIFMCIIYYIILYTVYIIYIII